MLFDYYLDQIPEYSAEMYLKGYTPAQILMAHRRMVYRDLIRNRYQAGYNNSVDISIPEEEETI